MLPFSSTRRSNRHDHVFGRLLSAISLLAVLAPAASAQNDWSAYGGAGGSNSRYSSLAQITPANVARLKLAWIWDSGEIAASFQTTPLVVDHVMYLNTPHERVVALDADTGKQIWSFDPQLKRFASYRGVSYWPGDARTPASIITGTTDGKIFALDAKTGLPAAGFGDNGEIDLRAELTAKYPNQSYGFTTPPAVYKDLIIFGPRVGESATNAKGPDAAIRAFNVRTGKEVWNFHTLPRPGETGYETWGPEFWKDGAGPSAWAGITVDNERGMVFVPTGNVSGGGPAANRKGDNLFANSVVALNANTGKLIWYYQMVHHDEWDYDVTAPPTLVDATKDGKKIPAVAQITKNGLLFILDRLTGKPIFGVEERAVPHGNTPDDELSPTQPFPLKPPPLARQDMSAADVSRISPESESYCSALVASHDHGGPFTARSGDNGRINFPSSIGGGNWGGVSFDPALGLIFVNSSNLGSFSDGARLEVAASAGDAGPGRGAARGGAPAAGRAPGGNRFVDQDRYPCNKPPWGLLTAVNANTGDIAWQVPLGSYKALEDKGIMNAGATNVGGSLVTASGVLFIGATNDQRFRAFDARSGKQLWQIDLAGGDAQANPMTYLSRDGKQVLVVANGGDGLTGGVGPPQTPVNGKIMAFTLPK